MHCHSSMYPSHIHVMYKASLIGLQIALKTRLGSATRHCARAMALPNDMISGLFAETAVVMVIQARARIQPYRTTAHCREHLPPAQTLQAAREASVKRFLNPIQ